MKPFERFMLIIVLLFIGFSVPVAFAGTTFTYQGRLLDNNIAADGLYDMQF